jgi:hypothetical protein
MPPQPRARRSHIEALLHAAAAAQTQSALAQRVSGWRSRIDPVLAAEEDRSAFDIHMYGTHILDVSARAGGVAVRPECACQPLARAWALCRAC